MDFVEHERQANNKDQPGKEAQRVGGDMRRNIGSEEECQRVVHQINKQRCVDEIGHPVGFKIQQAMA